MEVFFTPLHVFVATCAGFFVGALWYSPILFLKAWSKGMGLHTVEMFPNRSMLYKIQVNSYSFIAHGIMATVLAVLFDLLMITTLKAAVSLGLLLAFGFIVTTRFIDMVYTPDGKHYEMKSQLRFLVSSGYYLLATAVMSLTLFLLTL